MLPFLPAILAPLLGLGFLAASSFDRRRKAVRHPFRRIKDHTGVKGEATVAAKDRASGRAAALIFAGPGTFPAERRFGPRGGRSPERQSWACDTSIRWSHP